MHPVSSQTKWLLIAGSFFVVCLGFFVTPFMFIASVSFLILSVGLSVRITHRALHWKLMSLGILADVSLVLILEFQRSAINTAASFSLEPLQQAHIACSLVAVLLYIPVVILGVYRLKGWSTGHQGRWWHLRLGLGAFVFRALGFVLMFSLLDH